MGGHGLVWAGYEQGVFAGTLAHRLHSNCCCEPCWPTTTTCGRLTGSFSSLLCLRRTLTEDEKTDRRAHHFQTQPGGARDHVIRHRREARDVIHCFALRSLLLHALVIAQRYVFRNCTVAEKAPSLPALIFGSLCSTHASAHRIPHFSAYAPDHRGPRTRGCSPPSKSACTQA